MTIPILLRITRLLVGRRASGFVQVAKCRAINCRAVARVCELRIAPNYPVIGDDAFRTATGVHAAAVVKAFRKNDGALMDTSAGATRSSGRPSPPVEIALAVCDGVLRISITVAKPTT